MKLNWRRALVVLAPSGVVAALVGGLAPWLSENYGAGTAIAALACLMVGALVVGFLTAEWVIDG